MRRRTVQLAVPALLAGLVLGAAGCGGGGGGGKTNAATTAAGTTKATATTTAATTSALAGIASAANCKELADLGTKFSQALGTGAATGDAKKVAGLLQEFAAKTPSEIRPDFQTVADAFSKLADAVGGLTAGATPDAAALAKLQKVATEIDTKKLDQASQRIAAWAQKSCGKP